MNKPVYFLSIFFVLSISFRLVRLLFAIRKAKDSGRGRTAAKPMFWIMTISYLVFLGFCVAESGHHLSNFSWSISWLGVLLFLSALSVREMAMKDLGRFFSPDIEIRHKHQVIREGLYRYVRHPLLTCMAWEIIGLGLTFNAYNTLLIIGIGFYMPLILLRKSLEEKALLASLGDSYRTYQQDVGAFWPRWRALMKPKQELTHV